MYGHLVCRQRFTGVSSVRTIGSSNPSTRAVPSTYSTWKQARIGVSAHAVARRSASRPERSEVSPTGLQKPALNHPRRGTPIPAAEGCGCTSGILIWSSEDGSVITASLKFPYVYNVCGFFFFFLLFFDRNA